MYWVIRATANDSHYIPYSHRKKGWDAATGELFPLKFSTAVDTDFWNSFAL